MELAMRNVLVWAVRLALGAIATFALLVLFHGTASAGTLPSVAPPLTSLTSSVTQAARPVVGVVATAVAPDVQAAAPLTAAVAATATPVTRTAAAVLAPVAPVVSAVAPVVAPVVSVVVPAVTPVAPVVVPVLTPVTPIVAPVVAPVLPVEPPMVVPVPPVTPPVVPVVALSGPVTTSVATPPPGSSDVPTVPATVAGTTGGRNSVGATPAPSATRPRGVEDAGSAGALRLVAESSGPAGAQLPFTPRSPLPTPPSPGPACPTPVGSGGSGSPVHEGGAGVNPGGYLGDVAAAWRLPDFLGRVGLTDEPVVALPVTITVPPG